MKRLRFAALALAALTVMPLLLTLGCKGTEKPSDPNYYNGPMKKKGGGDTRAKGSGVD